MTKSKTLEEQAYEKIKESIMKGYYLPGSHLKETTLERDLQMSRTPIRRALVRLESEGFVKSESHHGSTVQNIHISMQEIISNIEIHLALIKFSLEKVKRKQIIINTEPLKDCIETMELAVETENHAMYYETIFAFDKLIISHTNNDLMIGILSDITERFGLGTTATQFRLRSKSFPNTLKQYKEFLSQLEQLHYDEAISIFENICKEAIMDYI